MLSLRHPIVLEGTNIFEGNTGGAITLTQTYMHTLGFIRFEGNRAENGGAVRMLDQSTVCCVVAIYIIII